MGQAIWLSATRYDGAFLITQCATILHIASKNVEKLGLFLSFARQLQMLICNTDLTFWFHPFPAHILESRPLQIIACPDAGFGSLAFVGIWFGSHRISLG